uniref:Interferon alpha-inducible protein 27-like protein 2A n=1 Tax=Dolomedes mizhoanus TaxID=1366394 RepID=S5MJX4_9ARAC|nr:hypothetical protein [Dolomedes mizhoanus]
MDPATLIFAGKVTLGAVAAVGGATVALPLLGFSSAGVAAGSVAAGVQSMIGNVAAGSAFASLQSAGVTGLAAATKAALATGGAAVAAFL